MSTFDVAALRLRHQHAWEDACQRFYDDASTLEDHVPTVVLYDPSGHTLALALASGDVDADRQHVRAAAREHSAVAALAVAEVRVGHPSLTQPEPAVTEVLAVVSVWPAQQYQQVSAAHILREGDRRHLVEVGTEQLHDGLAAMYDDLAWVLHDGDV